MCSWRSVLFRFLLVCCSFFFTKSFVSIQFRPRQASWAAGAAAARPPKPRVPAPEALEPVGPVGPVPVEPVTKSHVEGREAMSSGKNCWLNHW